MITSLAVVPCECCGSTNDVSIAPRMTAYKWDGTGEDPNKPPALCPRCTEDHIDFWESQWQDYYSGLI